MFKRLVCAIFAMVFLQSFSQLSLSLPQLKKERVAQYAKIIQRRLKRDYYLERSIKVATAGYYLFISGQFLYSAFFDKNTQQNCSCDKSLVPIISDKILPGQTWGNTPWKQVPGYAWGSFKAGCSGFLSGITSGAFLKAVAQLCGQAFVMSVTHTVVDSVTSQYVHEHTISWYVDTQACYTATIQVCTQLLVVYEQALKNSGDTERVYHVFKTMSSLLFRQVEKIIGYMEYRSGQLPSATKQDAMSIHEYLFEYAKEFRDVYKDALERKDSNSLSLLLEQFLNKVGYMVKGFSLFEEFPEKPSVIK